ncbi:MAG: hypothetical protein AABX16_02625 [Nanoarchaeota archaeon]
MADYDLLGNIAIIKSEKNGRKKKRAKKLGEAKNLLMMPNVKTVLEKVSRVKGRLRNIQVRHLAGEKTTVALYKENSCTFTFDVATCYFSPRLANDRKEIATKISKKNNVLCLFAGVGAYPIVISKIARPKKIVAIEISRACCQYFKKNLALNKISENDIEVIQGDVTKKINKDFLKKYRNFDIIVMTRPNLKASFLSSALLAAKKGARIFYNGFCHENDLNKMIISLEKEARILRKNIKIASVQKIGDIAPYKFRYRIEIIVKN